MLRHLCVCSLYVVSLFYAATDARPLFADVVDVNFTLNWRFEGAHGGILLAEDLGFFSDEDLNIQISSASGTDQAIERIVSGSHDMGLVDLNALIRYLASAPEAPITAVMILHETSPFAIVGRASQGVTNDPHSLEGRVLGAPPTDAAYANWSSFAEAADIDVSEVEIRSVSYAEREQMLARGEVDAVFGFSFSSVMSLRSQGVPAEDIVTILMADHGLDLYGLAIAANEGFAETYPDAVRGVLRAISRGVSAASDDYQAGADAVLARNGDLSLEIEAERLQLATELHILTASALEGGFGTADDDRLRYSLDYHGQSLGVGGLRTIDIFDSSFLP